MRLRKLRAQLRVAIVDHHILGGDTFETPTNRLNKFAGWLQWMATSALINDRWSIDYVVKAFSLGVARADRELKTSTTAPHDGLTKLLEWRQNELNGIIAALVQQTTRAAHSAEDRKLAAPAMCRCLMQPFDTTIRNRLHAFTNSMIVKAYNAAKLEVYQAQGVRKVGIDPELKLYANRTSRIKDADEDDDELTQEITGEESGGMLVGVLTAGDEKVCPTCCDIADESPYDIDDALDLIPAHPSCRCSYYPWQGVIEDAPTVEAAGVMFMTPEGDVLYVLRGPDGDHPNEWSIPAGGVEPDEVPSHAAHREAAEETGSPGDHELELIDQRVNKDGVMFYTFLQPVRERFDPILNGEHTT
jgi:hypothetical protein